MTPNAVAFYAVAALIVLAAGAAVGLPSLRHGGYAGAAVIVLLAVLELISGAYALAVIQLVVPGIAIAIVVLVLRHNAYGGLVSAPTIPPRLWIAAPVAVGIGAVLVVTLALVGSGWYPGDLLIALINRFNAGTALVTVLHYREPYALAIVAVLVAITVGAALVIGRRSTDEQTLDQRIQQRREREDLARRRREDREQGRRRPARSDS